MGDGDGVTRRDFLRGALDGRKVALAATGGLAWVHTLDDARAAPASVRPPGALPERDFQATCIKCGQCVEACPFDTLSLATAGEEPTLGTPYFEPRKTPCFMCPDVPCIQACPTDSLEKGTAIEDARMGLAVLSDHETCLAYRGLRCEVCYRACPLIGKAISLEFRPQERTGKHAYFIPVVNSDACTGCGKCERSCVLEESAIRVLPRDQVQGKLGENYRFGWLEAPEISQDYVAPLTAPDVPEWDHSLKRVLEQMDDLSGIEEP